MGQSSSIDIKYSKSMFQAENVMRYTLRRNGRLISVIVGVREDMKK